MTPRRRRTPGLRRAARCRISANGKAAAGAAAGVSRRHCPVCCCWRGTSDGPCHRPVCGGRELAEPLRRQDARRLEAGRLRRPGRAGGRGRQADAPQRRRRSPASPTPAATAICPTTNYEIALEAQAHSRRRSLCWGLTFPVGDSYASLIIGGWGGSLCGISSLEDEDAAHNETHTNRRFKTGQWYRIRLRVLPERLVAWVDDDKIIDVNTKGKKISLRTDIDASKPLGLSSFQTTAAIKDIKIRKLGETEQ